MCELGDVERAIDDFEQLWRKGIAPSVATFARARLVGAYASCDLAAVIQELIAVDLEYRWKRFRRGRSDVPALEEYWQSLRPLGLQERVPLELVGEEYRARQLWGDRPSHEEVIARFPERPSALSQLLAEVDCELQLERGDRTDPAALTSTGALSGGGGGAMIESTPLLPPVGNSWARFQDYLLHEMIGAGQMGRVYRATYLPSGREAAVKYLRKSFHRDRHATDRFLQEARLVSKLAHPGLTPIQEVGRTPSGGYFLVMELLAGPNLATVIGAGDVEIGDAVRWTRQAAEAITYANSAGIIHCDLKPGNIVLDRDRQARVTDFGLARTIDEGTVATGDRIAGTAPYMAPEQVSGWWGTIGAATDVYGLGAVLYTLLAGRAPFVGATAADVLVQVVSAALPTAIGELRPEVPNELAAIVGIALTKSPQARYSSAAELAAVLRVINSWN